MKILNGLILLTNAKPSLLPELDNFKFKRLYSGKTDKSKGVVTKLVKLQGYHQQFCIIRS